MSEELRKLAKLALERAEQMKGDSEDEIKSWARKLSAESAELTDDELETVVGGRWRSQIPHGPDDPGKK